MERTCGSKWVYVAAANRIGLEQYLPDTAGIEFWGASLAGPQGEILAQASHDKEIFNRRS
jgi:N-carbamoylputrescine amidase